MATTIDAISAMLTEMEYEHRRIATNAVGLGFATSTYRALDGDAGIRVVIDLVEDGRFVRLFAPMAFRIEGEHRHAAIETCSRFEWQFKMIRFELDGRDGEVRPSIHLPLMDAPLSAAQLMRAMKGLVSLCDAAFPLISAALERGEVMSPDDDEDDAPAEPERVSAVVEHLARLTPEQLDVLLAALDESTPESV